ncbi:hypothetical protein [Rathayibacter sp. VKM Ac-2760]|uniref:hypothetical protein n=1 Tax=Rathayibacter sp. VKM Ac-2760 TaxID=2609253 RepID=UPI00131608A8|nr:hypothetical protein [Rathayibacter sp. VKM Ac-2760]QHC60256.1 hypothetical protein GSU72_18130 [Rathayibacter sp. VKM Ac-2760]
MDTWRHRLPTGDWAPVFSGPVDAVPREALDDAARILRLLPGIERLSIGTPDGPIIAERGASSAAWQAADRVAMALLASSPAVTGITAHAFDARDGVRYATPADPFLTRDGGRIAALRASEQLGEISAEEAERRHAELLAGADAEDPLEALWDAESRRGR